MFNRQDFHSCAYKDEHIMSLFLRRDLYDIPYRLALRLGIRYKEYQLLTLRKPVNKIPFESKI